MDHLNSKSAILGWIINTYRAHIESWDLDTKNIRANINSRDVQIRPDAYVRFRNGVTVAVEFQHSAGDPERVLAKTRAYERAGITAWWIFSGRSPKTCCKVKPGKKLGWFKAELNEAQTSLVNNQIPFFWYDHEHRLLATPTVWSPHLIPITSDELWTAKHPRTEQSYSMKPFPGWRSPVMFRPEPLTECAVNLETGNLITTTTTWHIRHREAAARETEALRAAARQRFLDLQTEQERKAQAAREARAKALEEERIKKARTERQALKTPPAAHEPTAPPNNQPVAPARPLKEPTPLPVQAPKMRLSLTRRIYNWFRNLF